MHCYTFPRELYDLSKNMFLMITTRIDGPVKNKQTKKQKEETNKKTDCEKVKHNKIKLTFAVQKTVNIIGCQP